MQPTRCDWISISNLLPNSTYEVQRWETTVLGHIDFRYQSSEMIIVTTSEEVASLLPVSDFKVTLNLAGNSYEAVVEWTPGKGKILNKNTDLQVFDFQIFLVSTGWMLLV